MPEPVGADTSTSWPAAIAGQACSCAAVGRSNERVNQSRTCGVNDARGSDATRPTSVSAVADRLAAMNRLRQRLGALALVGALAAGVSACADDAQDAIRDQADKARQDLEKRRDEIRKDIEDGASREEIEKQLDELEDEAKDQGGKVEDDTRELRKDLERELP